MTKKDKVILLQVLRTKGSICSSSDEFIALNIDCPLCVLYPACMSTFSLNDSSENLKYKKALQLASPEMLMEALL